MCLEVFLSVSLFLNQFHTHHKSTLMMMKWGGKEYGLLTFTV